MREQLDDGRHCAPLSGTEASPETKPMLEPKTFKFQGRSKKLRGLEKCGMERSMSRRSLLRILAGIAATPYASRRARAGPHVAASVAVGYDQPGRIIPENFIGLSYESAVLASPDYLSPRNLSSHGLVSRSRPWRRVASRRQYQRTHGVA